jgi:hypothetical protein
MAREEEGGRGEEAGPQERDTAEESASSVG